MPHLEERFSAPPPGGLSLINSTFVGNLGVHSDGSGEFGGAIYNTGSATVTNSAFQANGAAQGGTIENRSLLTLNNSIIVDSRESGTGAIDNNVGGTANANNNAYYNNQVADCYSCASNNNATDASSEPLAVPIGNYGGPTETLLPQPGSAAICAGSASLAKDGNGNALTTDQRGFAFNYSYCSNGGVDAGAVQTNYLTVTTLNDQSESTTCTGGAACSLRDALAAPANQGTADVLFSSGLVSATKPGLIVLKGSLPAITGRVDVFGPGPNQLTVSGGQVVGRLFTVNSGATALLSGLTIANASTGGDGGALNNAGTLSLTDIAVSGNFTYGNGGGIANSNTATIKNSTISGNTSAQNGGGIYNTGTLTLTGSTISGNTTNGTASTIYGGGVYNSGTLSLSGSTVSDNSVVAPGDGVGGGIYSNGSMALANSIVAGNSASQIYADMDAAPTDLGGNIVSDNSAKTSQIAIQLSPLQLNGIGAALKTMIPLPGSPAICAGILANIPSGSTTDERGYPNTNTTYNGYSSSSPCVDSGAVQTNYTGIQWAQQPTNTMAGIVITPSPSVKVLETDTLLSSNNTDAVLGVPVTLSLNGGLTLSTGTLTQPSADTSTIAVFNGLEPNSVGTGYSFSTDEFTVVGSDILASVASADFNVTPLSAPTVALAFSPNVVALNATSTLTITITNPATNSLAITGMKFNDALPSGLTIGSNTTNSCGSILTTGPSSISLSNFSLAPGSSCAITAPISSAHAGVYQDSLTVTSSNAVTSNTASAALQAGTMPPTIAASFTPASTGFGRSSTLSITITNPNGLLGLTGVGFSDKLPSGLSIGNSTGNTCGSILTTGSSSISLSNFSLTAGSNCKVTFPITPREAGVFHDSTSVVTSSQAGNGSSASATLTVTGPAAITFPPSGSTLTGTTATFSWTAGTGVTQYSLHVGTAGADSTNIFGGPVSGQSKFVSGIPTTGGTLYVRLYSLIGGALQFHDYTYKEADFSKRSMYPLLR